MNLLPIVAALLFSIPPAQSTPVPEAIATPCSGAGNVDTYIDKRLPEWMRVEVRGIMLTMPRDQWCSEIGGSDSLDRDVTNSYETYVSQVRRRAYAWKRVDSVHWQAPDGKSLRMRYGALPAWLVGDWHCEPLRPAEDNNFEVVFRADGTGIELAQEPAQGERITPQGKFAPFPGRRIARRFIVNYIADASTDMVTAQPGMVNVSTEPTPVPGVMKKASRLYIGPGHEPGEVDDVWRDGKRVLIADSGFYSPDGWIINPRAPQWRCTNDRA